MIINLFTTANMATGRSDALQRMLISLAEARQARPELRIRLLLLLQNCPEAPAEGLGCAEREFTTVMTVPGLVSLSKARNILLEEAGRLEWLAEDGIVAFPDDDCWYPAGCLDHVHDRFAAQSDLDFWFCDYSSKPEPIDPTLERVAHTSDVLRRASSNTMIFRSRVISRIGPFDPNLGVGAVLSGSEDTDYALRAHFVSRRTVFLPQTVIGHRDRNPLLRAKYYPAGLFVLARHTPSDARLGTSLARKAAIGAALVLRREITVSTFFKAVAGAAGEWSRARRHTARTSAKTLKSI